MRKANGRNRVVSCACYNLVMTKESPAIDPGVRIGHVHLKVSDLDRSLAFYCGVLGFKLIQRMGHSAAFYFSRGYHHHIGLNTWESLGAGPPPAHSTGLFHVAIVYPTRAKLADALRQLMNAKIELDGAADHGVSEALYLRDPDQNGVELYWDRPADQWPRKADGGWRCLRGRWIWRSCWHCRDNNSPIRFQTQCPIRR